MKRARCWRGLQGESLDSPHAHMLHFDGKDFVFRLVVRGWVLLCCWQQVGGLQGSFAQEGGF